MLRSPFAAFIIFEQFAKQLPHFGFGANESFTSPCRRPVHTALGAADKFFYRSKQTLFFKAVKDWIESAGAQLIAMAAELLDHGEAVDVFPDRVVQYMKADKPSVKDTMICPRVLCRRALLIHFALPLIHLDTGSEATAGALSNGATLDEPSTLIELIRSSAACKLICDYQKPIHQLSSARYARA